MDPRINLVAVTGICLLHLKINIGKIMLCSHAAINPYVVNLYENIWVSIYLTTRIQSTFAI